MRLFIFIALLASSTLLMSQAQEKQYGIQDQMPLFDGASTDEESQQKVIAFFQEKASKELVDSDGIVFIQFVVDDKGTAIEPKVLKSNNSELDTFAIRYVNEMPKWEPGTKEKEKVAVQFTVPVRFERAD